MKKRKESDWTTITVLKTTKKLIAKKKIDMGVRTLDEALVALTGTMTHVYDKHENRKVKG